MNEVNVESESGKSSKLDEACALVDLSEDTDEEGGDGNDFNVSLKVPAIQTTANALNAAEDLLHFSYFTGNEELSQALLPVNDILTDMRLAGQKQTYITHFLKPS